MRKLTIKEWRDKTINNLFYKTQKELRLQDKQITEIGNRINTDDWPESLHHDEIRKSIDSRFDEILVKLNYRLLDLKLLESQEHTITSSQASNLIKLANRYRAQTRLKMSLSSDKVDFKG